MKLQKRITLFAAGAIALGGAAFFAAPSASAAPTIPTSVMQPSQYSWNIFGWGRHNDNRDNRDNRDGGDGGGWRNNNYGGDHRDGGGGGWNNGYGGRYNRGDD